MSTSFPLALELLRQREESAGTSDDRAMTDEDLIRVVVVEHVTENTVASAALVTEVLPPIPTSVASLAPPTACRACITGALIDSADPAIVTPRQ